jgi:hypothetical protein
LVTGLALATEDPAKIWFPSGVESVDIGIAPEKVAALQNSCVKCHGGAHKEWAVSAHAKAWTDPLFQEGFRLEAKNRCVHCHAPLEEQFKEYTGQGQGSLLATGVNCIACHVRDGVVHSAKRSGNAPHPVIQANSFGSAKFCAGCHDFHFSNAAGPAATVAQSTYREWLSYTSKGGTKSCINCHSSPLHHSFPGPNKLLTAAIDLKWKIQADNLEFTITNKGAGHAFPTGDLFREAVLEISKDNGKTFERIHRIGKTYDRLPGISSEPGLMKLIEDSRIGPMESAVVKVPRKNLGKSVRYQMIYFRSPEVIRNKSNLPNKLWRSIVKSGSIIVSD